VLDLYSSSPVDPSRYTVHVTHPAVVRADAAVNDGLSMFKDGGYQLLYRQSANCFFYCFGLGLVAL
jgi:hypothetical protein